MNKIQVLQNCWYARNPSREINLDSGENMFWETLLMVIDDYNKTCLDKIALDLGWANAKQLDHLKDNYPYQDVSAYGFRDGFIKCYEAINNISTNK